MAKISAALVKELRDRTDLGMMDCKRALEESDGDIEIAIENLRKSSGMKAAKKAGRIAADGLVGVSVSDSRSVLVEVNCETDFAARDDNFVAFVNRVVSLIADSGNGDIQALLDDGLEAEREALVQKIGENVSVRRAEVLDGAASSYIHNGKIGVLVQLADGDDDLGKDVAMHVAAADPQPRFVSSDDVPEDVIAKEKEIFVAQAAESGKPPEIIEKMVGGRVKKFLAEISLVDQPFIKNPDQKVGALLKENGGSVSRFVRFQVGEGIEKEEVDFADEVKNQLKDADDPGNSDDKD
ncbi:MAG: elongation factor Ts [Gammaproteobacteria bacterium]|nr:elongation factor Ts [Gammaproteobacteria bacterium]OUU06361.1 MAG: translation elongation factor Ts [Gammaproteobacteria bacterium TMED34]